MLWVTDILFFTDVDNCNPKYHHFDEGIGLTENGLCGFNGRCIDYVGYYKCDCNEGWSGVSCQNGEFKQK